MPEGGRPKEVRPGFAQIGRVVPKTTQIANYTVSEWENLEKKGIFIPFFPI